MTGTTLSHYRITDELGRGGMGIVYLAEDTKLDRQVAIKVLPSSALASEDDRARFYREAKAAAALNHPNIAQIYQIDEAVPSDAPHGTQPSPFIAMEYIDGEPLDARIRRGPLKLAEAVRIATQIAGALGEAHEKGIVHRDVKTSNVMLTSKGDAKVLDFGLALTAASTKLTRMGSTLGTVAYMSPEQARGEEVDRRTDLWALGVVLYEMVAGRNPFGGDYEQAVVYSILNAEPEPLTAVRTGVPMELEQITGKLLRKDRDTRYQSAAGVLADLKGLSVALSGVGSSTTRLSTAVARRPGLKPSESRLKRLSFAVIPVALLMLLAGYLAGAYLGAGRPGIEHPVIRSEIPLPGIQNLVSIDVTRDGRYLAFIGAASDGRIAGILDMTTGRISRILNADASTEVAVSSDGQWVLLTNPDGVARASINGGRAQEFIATDEAFPQAGAGTQAITLYEDIRSIWAHDESTGDRRMLIGVDSTDGIIDLDWPRLLPDGETVLATIEYADSRVAIGFWDLASGELRSTYEPGGYRARVLESGHLLFFQAGDLLAVPFDTRRLEATAAPIPLMTIQSRSMYAVSDAGVLIAGRSGTPDTPTANDAPFLHEVQIYDFRSSNATPLPMSAGLFSSVESDPGGFVLAVTRYKSTGQSDVWIQMLRDGGEFQITTDGSSGDARWFSGGDSLLYVRRGSSPASERTDALIVTSATGGATVSVDAGSDVGGRINDVDITDDGSMIVYSQSIPGSESQGSTVVLLDRWSGTRDWIYRDARPITEVDLSPDGEYVALNVDGRVIVTPTEASGGSLSLSDGPGTRPRWSPDGLSVYFIRNRELVRVPVRLRPTFGRTGAAEVVVATNSVPIPQFDLLGARQAAAIADYALGFVPEPEAGDVGRPALELLTNLPRELVRIQDGKN